MKNAISLLMAAGAYIAALVGAGFATGAEIVAYFVQYGKISILGIVMSALIFGLAAYIILASEYDNLSEFCIDKLGKIPAFFINILSALFMLCIFITMVSCSGEFGEELLGMPKPLGVAFIIVCSFFVLLCGIKNFTIINGILGIILSVGLMLICRHIMLYRLENVFNPIDNWAISSVSYSGYNMISAAAVLFAMSKNISSKKQAAIVGIISGVVIFVLMAAIWCVIKIFYGKIPLGDIPLLTITQRQGGILVIAYALMLEAAVLTTCFSAGFGVCSILKKYTKLFYAVFIISAIGIIFSAIPFSTLIDKAYRIFGILILICFLPSIKNIFKIKNKRKTIKTKENV